MWFFNKQVESPATRFIKTCMTCGCLVGIGRAKAVVIREVYARDVALFYCAACAPPYEFRDGSCLTGVYRYFHTVPAHQVEVTEEGEPIKARKTKKEDKKNGGS